MGYSWSNGRKVMALALRLAMVPLRLITLFLFHSLPHSLEAGRIDVSGD